MNKLRGLVAASYTPLNADESLNLDAVEGMVEHLAERDVGGVFICGSTGEGLSLSSAERMAVSERFIAAAKGRLKTIVHVGHHSLEEAGQLAGDAEAKGADAISALAPCYYPLDDSKTLAESIAKIASRAPDTPCYYYHIPCLTGIQADLIEFLEIADGLIPNLIGVKYTDNRIDQLMKCLSHFGERYDMVWGFDEMSLPAMAAGAQAFIGSTFNFAAPLYLEIMAAFESGDLERARRLQSLSIAIIDAINIAPFHPMVKCILSRLGVAAGPARLPLRNPSAAEVEQVWSRLEQLGAVGEYIR
jgi:N-acetylneuraminate lyase